MTDLAGVRGKHTRTTEVRPDPAAGLRRLRPSLLFGSLARRGLLRRLAAIEDGYLEVVDEAGAVHRCGAAGSTPAARVTVRHPSFFTDLAFGGTIGAAESFMAHAWDCDDLPALIRLMVRNRDVLDALDSGSARLLAPMQRLVHARRRNSRQGSRRNIAAHYDLGDDLFEHFLDGTMTYSSACFAEPGMTLEAAQEHKIDRLGQRLALRPEHRLLEIGTGWGTLMCRLAARFGCHIDSTTISENQAARARQRVADAGLGERARVLELDYRDLHGRYDRLVSVEMIEAVGHDHLHVFMRKCSDLLTDDGAMALQAITIADAHYARAVREVDFIKRWIFPGSFIPSVSAVLNAMAAATDLRLLWLEDLGLHYAETLRRWRLQFLARRDELAARGYDERFLRLWEFYLAYCEGGFAERFLGVAQMVLIKPRSSLQTLPVAGTR